jgi:tetratricopeptide (TPR) repeat protein
MTDPAGGANDKQQKRAQTYFQTGNDAALKNNLDYAVTMYREALKLEEGNLLYRQALRGVQRRKFQNDPAKVGMLVGARNQPIRLRAGGAKNKGRWSEALEHCEDAFANNPWDVHAAMIAAEAATGLGQHVLARWLMESVIAQAGEDAAYFRLLAQVYEHNQDWERSINCWEKVRKLAPQDDEAIRKIRGLQASATISRSGLEGAIHRASEGAAAEALQEDLDDLKRQAQTPEERLRKQIEDDPQRVGAYLELADLLKMGNKLDEAEKILGLGIKAVPDENLLQEAYADIQIARLQRALGAWKRKAREAPDDPTPRAKLEQITAMLADYTVKEFRRRVERRPEDSTSRFQLASTLTKAARWDEAIAEFQKCRNDPAFKLQSLYQTGLCFEAKNLPKLAERSYQEALKSVDAASDQDLLNRLHYRLGRVAEAQGDLKAAEEHYNEVAAVDYGYEDVAQRLENLNRRGDS